MRLPLMASRSLSFGFPILLLACTPQLEDCSDLAGDITIGTTGICQVTGRFETRPGSEATYVRDNHGQLFGIELQSYPELAPSVGDTLRVKGEYTVMVDAFVDIRRITSIEVLQTAPDSYEFDHNRRR